MLICQTIDEIKKVINGWKKEGCSIGFVPTMGYLHEGHATLVRKAVSENAKTVVSIFVNPMQFGPTEDLAAYPRDFERDKALLENLNADAVFYPSYEEMYGENNLTSVYVSSMSEKLCGITRPIHFKGVTTVIAKFFNIIGPDNAYFGLKDYQQYAIIRKMTKDLNFNVKITGMPIVRGDDGLALSSRNIYLDGEEKESALSLNQSLKLAKKMLDNNERISKKIINAVGDYICSVPYTKIDYIKIVDRETLEDIDTVTPGCSAILLAVYVGKARLIDNTLL